MHVMIAAPELRPGGASGVYAFLTASVPILSLSSLAFRLRRRCLSFSSNRLEKVVDFREIFSETSHLPSLLCETRV